MNDTKGHWDRTKTMTPQTIQIPAAGVMVSGLRGDYHISKHRLKCSHTPFDCGIDLYAARVEPQVIALANCTILRVSTMVHLTLPVGSFGIVCERSSTIEKLAGARVKTGYIDAGYTGEILIDVVCQSDAFNHVMNALTECASNELAIAQFIIMQCLMPMFRPFDEKLVPGKRGNAGYGSTDALKVL